MCSRFHGLFYGVVMRLGAMSFPRMLLAPHEPSVTVALQGNNPVLGLSAGHQGSAHLGEAVLHIVNEQHSPYSDGKLLRQCLTVCAMPRQFCVLVILLNRCHARV
jgi:hypothetical protein